MLAEQREKSDVGSPSLKKEGASTPYIIKKAGIMVPCVLPVKNLNYAYEFPCSCFIDLVPFGSGCIFYPVDVAARLSNGSK